MYGPASTEKVERYWARVGISDRQPDQAVDEGHVHGGEIGIQRGHGAFDERLVVGGHVVRIDLQILGSQPTLLSVDLGTHVGEVAQNHADVQIDFVGVLWAQAYGHVISSGPRLRADTGTDRAGWRA